VALASIGNATLGSASAGGALSAAIGGNLAATSLTSLGSDVVGTVGGNATITKVTAPGTVNIAVGGGSLLITGIDPTDIYLSVAGEGGLLDVDLAYASNSVNLMADNIDVNVVDPDDGTLRVSVSGNDGGIADNVMLNITTLGAIVYETFRSMLSTLVSQSSTLYFSDLVVGDYMTIETPDIIVTLDYKDSKDNENSDILATRNVPIELLIDDTKVTTDGHENLFIFKDKQ